MEILVEIHEVRFCIGRKNKLFPVKQFVPRGHGTIVEYVEFVIEWRCLAFLETILYTIEKPSPFCDQLRFLASFGNSNEFIEFKQLSKLGLFEVQLTLKVLVKEKRQSL